MNQAAGSKQSARFSRMFLVTIGTALLIGIPFATAQETDTLAAPKKTTPQEKETPEEKAVGQKARELEALEMKARAEKNRLYQLRITAEEQAKEISRDIVIDEEGIVLNGKKYHYEQLEDSIISSLTIEGGSIIKLGEPVLIKEDEIVDGDLLSFGGEVTVFGTVSGDVAIVGADLYLKPTGIIKGDIFTLGGSVHQEPGGEIRGQRINVLRENLRVYGPFPMFFSHFENLVTFGIPLLFFVIISFLFLALAGFFVPRHVERIGEAIQVAPLRSILLGFAALVLALPLFILLCVTIIGIPVALIAQPIAYFVAGIMGFAGVSLFVGIKLRQGAGALSESPLSRIFLGALIIEGALILAWFFTLGGKAFAPLFWLFYLIGWIVYLVALMAGLGAVIGTRFGIRPITAPATPTPPVPPPAGPEQLPADPESPAPV
jgi:hypothetical protein